MSEKIEDLVLASQSLPDVTSAIRELTSLAKGVTLTQSQLQTIKQGFCCVVCLSKYAMDIFYMVCVPELRFTNKKHSSVII